MFDTVALDAGPMVSRIAAIGISGPPGKRTVLSVAARLSGPPPFPTPDTFNEKIAVKSRNREVLPCSAERVS